MPIIAAKDVTLAELSDRFGLQPAPDANFFTEWSQINTELSTELSEIERQVLDRIQANFTSLMRNPPALENSVKMVVLAPILDLLGFYQPPFSLRTEAGIEISTEDEGTIIRGRIDILVLKNRLWLTVIESKRSDFSVTRAIPQTLSYMLANPQVTQPSFGLVTNGSEYLFLKTTQQPAQYANSQLFSLINPGNELYRVASILKALEQSVSG